MSQPQNYQPGPQSRGLFTDLYDRISEKVDDVINNRPSDESSNIGDAFTMDNLRHTFNLDDNSSINENSLLNDNFRRNDNSFMNENSLLNDNFRRDDNSLSNSRSNDFYGSNFDNNRTFMRGNQRCRIVCDPPQNQGGNLNRISRRLIGLSIRQAKQIYSNIRVVEINGRRQPTTFDRDRTRINVETRNDIIIRIDGIY